jgi:hypothetical protein
MELRTWISKSLFVVVEILCSVHKTVVLLAVSQVVRYVYFSSTSLQLFCFFPIVLFLCGGRGGGGYGIFQIPPNHISDLDAHVLT